MRRAVKSSEATTYEAPTPDHRRWKLLFEREIFKEASIPLTKNIASGLTIIRPKTQQPAGGVHEASEEIYYVLSGKGRLKLDDELIELEKGTAAFIGYGVEHQLFNTGDEDLVLFWVNVPPLMITNLSPKSGNTSNSKEQRARHMQQCSTGHRVGLA